MKNILKSSGFRKNWIYETIVTTENDGKKHAAPMGVMSPDQKKIRLAVYQSSETYRNISGTGFFVINLSDDMELFYESLYQRKKLGYTLPKGFIVPVLKRSDAVMEARVLGEKNQGEKTIFTAEIISYQKINKKETKLINRAESLAFEALIKSSKILSSKDEKEKKKLLEELRYIVSAASKTAPNSPSSRTASRILSLFC